MQTLKRFTQCGSLTMLFAVFIVLFGVSSTALTTFGKSSPNAAPLPVTPAPAKGRECNTHSDCSLLQFTSCVKDLEDDKTRCLCGDNLAPVNGLCTAKYRGLHHMCTDSTQCEDEMVCVTENVTKTTALGGPGSSASSSSGGGVYNRQQQTQQQQPASKVCLCDEENGYVEDVEDSRCNGAIQLVTGGGGLLLLPVALIVQILGRKVELQLRH